MIWDFGALQTRNCVDCRKHAILGRKLTCIQRQSFLTEITAWHLWYLKKRRTEKFSHISWSENYEIVVQKWPEKSRYAFSLPHCVLIIDNWPLHNIYSANGVNMSVTLPKIFGNSATFRHIPKSLSISLYLKIENYVNTLWFTMHMPYLNCIIGPSRVTCFFYSFVMIITWSSWGGNQGAQRSGLNLLLCAQTDLSRKTSPLEANKSDWGQKWRQSSSLQFRLWCLSQ